MPYYLNVGSLLKCKSALKIRVTGLLLNAGSVSNFNRGAGLVLKAESNQLKPRDPE